MRLIDADAVWERYDNELCCVYDWRDAYIWLKQCIDEAPTIDAEPVVRCKDCYHFEPFDCPDGWGICKLHNDSEWHGNDHCSYGCE